MTTPTTASREALGPAERIINSMLAHADHMVHNRPGVIVPDGRTVTGVRWSYATHKNIEGEGPVVFLLNQVGKKTVPQRIGVRDPNGVIHEGGREVARYQPAGIFSAVALWMYRNVAEVWKTDNEFAARWASYAHAQEHRDLKVVLAAFALVQSRKGEPVTDAGKVIFFDADYRDVGEAMMLLYRKGTKTDFDPKLILRVRDVLRLPEIAAMNRELGFTKSTKPTLGRWPTAVIKWLSYREENPKLLEGLVAAGFRSQVMELVRHSGYKPSSERFFEVLRWKQKQAEDGRRTLAIGKAVTAAESWEGLSEEQVCDRIVTSTPRLSYKRITSLVPRALGLTRAMVAAAVEAGCMSEKELIIATPTLEELGLLAVPTVKAKWDAALKNAEDMRAANLARNVKTVEVKEQLEAAADTALQKKVEEVMKGLRVYFMIDRSGSMNVAIEAAKACLTRFLAGFPADKIHISTFNSVGKEIVLPHASAKGVEAAFRGMSADGGTDYGAGVKALAAHRPKDEEDALFFFVGDEEAATFAEAVRRTGFNPVAFALLHVGGQGGRGTCVKDTARELNIPCIEVTTETFNVPDPYTIPRTLRTLIASTPVARGPALAPPKPRETLVDVILKTPLLAPPAWAI